MQPGRKKRRHSTVALLLLVWLAIGLASPLVMKVQPGDFELGAANVNAAPRDSVMIAEPVALSLLPAITIVKGTAALFNPTSKPLSGEAALGVLAGGQARLLLEAGAISVRLDHLQADSSINQVLPRSPIVTALAGLNFDTVSLRKMTLVAVLPDGRTETLSDVTGELTHRRKAALQLNVTGNLRGERVEVRTAISIASDAVSVKNLPIKLHIKSAALDANIDGALATTAKPRLQGRLDASVPSLRAFTRMFGDGWPVGPGLRDFKAKGQLDWSEQGLLVSDGQFAMDGNEATGSLLLNPNTPRPSLAGTLAFKTLELTEYARAVKDSRSRLAAWWQWLMKDDHARSIVHLIDADLRLSADKVNVSGIPLGRTATALTLKAGRLKANVADFELDGGTGSGEIGLDYSGTQPRMSVRGKLGGIDAARLSSILIGAEALSGSATLTADLLATGGSIADLSNSAVGKLQVSMRDGGRVNADLKSLLAAVQKREATGWGAVRRSPTPFETLEMRLGLRGGMIAIEQAVIGAGEAQLTATGAIDTMADKLDARVSFGPHATQAGKADALLLNGALSAPRIRSEAATRAAQPTPERASQPRG